MPELPEVETTRRGIAPALEGLRIRELKVRERRLRWPVPKGLEKRLRNQPVLSVRRRAKYLLLEIPQGCFMVHLGMSGSMRIVPATEQPEKHDHFDIVTERNEVIRFNDPRRFGSLLWGGSNPESHPLLARLGPEPLSDEFEGASLWRGARHRKVAIKQHIMNSHVVVGVGNIYASEALFRAGIHPNRAAGKISAVRMERLANVIKEVLGEAIRVGGTTLRDYRNSAGKPGYFQQKLNVYERASKPCTVCNTPVKRIVQGQRATYYCPQCQR